MINVVLICRILKSYNYETKCISENCFLVDGKKVTVQKNVIYTGADKQVFKTIDQFIFSLLDCGVIHHDRELIKMMVAEYERIEKIYAGQ